MHQSPETTNLEYKLHYFVSVKCNDEIRLALMVREVLDLQRNESRIVYEISVNWYNLYGTNDIYDAN